jgi:ribosomal protein S18 acetylase RimI-like enzyme
VIHELEERAASAWPALATVYLDGWVVRFADGYTRRANSASPLYEGSGRPDEKIDQCERLYAARRQRCIFKLTPAQAALDDLLACRGYSREAPSLVQVADLARLPAAPSAAVTGTERPSERWLGDFARLNGVAEPHAAAMRRVLEAIVPSRRFGLLEVDGETAALGLAVVDRGWVGLYDVVTAPARRGQGHATGLLLHLLGWAAAEAGATRAYLQVAADNAPALALYRKLGFTEAYPYWYRVAPRAG